MGVEAKLAAMEEQDRIEKLIDLLFKDGVPKILLALKGRSMNCN